MTASIYRTVTNEIVKGEIIKSQSQQDMLIIQDKKAISMSLNQSPLLLHQLPTGPKTKKSTGDQKEYRIFLIAQWVLFCYVKLNVNRFNPSMSFSREQPTFRRKKFLPSFP